MPAERTCVECGGPLQWRCPACRIAQSAQAAMPAERVALSDGDELWLWKNGDHYLAFRHLYPCFEPGGDPMTLGEPAGRAVFRESHDRVIQAQEAKL